VELLWVLELTKSNTPMDATMATSVPANGLIPAQPLARTLPLSYSTRLLALSASESLPPTTAVELNLLAIASHSQLLLVPLLSLQALKDVTPSELDGTLLTPFRTLLLLPPIPSTFRDRMVNGPLLRDRLETSTTTTSVVETCPETNSDRIPALFLSLLSAKLLTTLMLETKSRSRPQLLTVKEQVDTLTITKLWSLSLTPVLLRLLDLTLL